MQRIQLEEDIQPLSEFRSRVTYYLEKIKKDRRPLVITQNGKSAAILINVSEYEKIMGKIELLEDIKLAETQITDGKHIAHSTVKKRLAKRIRN